MNKDMSNKLKSGMSEISGRVLLIDDDRIFGKIIQTAASELGMKLDTLVDAPSKRKIPAMKQYDLVLLDYDLEGTTGFALAEQMNKLLPNVPVILISSSNRPYQDKLGRLPNIIGFVSKWSKPEEFFTRSVELYKVRPLAAA